MVYILTYRMLKNIIHSYNTKFLLFLFWYQTFESIFMIGHLSVEKKFFYIYILLFREIVCKKPPVIQFDSGHKKNAQILVGDNRCF